mmetsp:Transcript_12837/g.50206  ORF Transcript_12837/g.50206 Transcript_12837/m.50206 type:complete len:431 (-) Transcript_12837:1175-2467(-)
MSAAGLRASLAPRASAASGGRAGDGRARRAAKARPAPRRRDRSPIHDADAATRTTAPAVSADAVQPVVAPTTLEARSSDPAIGDASAPARPPVETCQHVHLGSASSVAEALARVRAGLRGLTQDASGQSRGSVPPFASGVVRLTVAVPRTVDALEWLRSLPEHDDLDDDDQFGDDAAGVKAALLPRYYLSPRTPPPAIRSGEGDDGGDEHRHNRGTRDRGKGPGPTNDDGGADGGADGAGKVGRREEHVRGRRLHRQPRIVRRLRRGGAPAKESLRGGDVIRARPRPFELPPLGSRHSRGHGRRDGAEAEHREDAVLQPPRGAPTETRGRVPRARRANRRPKVSRVDSIPDAEPAKRLRGFAKRGEVVRRGFLDTFWMLLLSLLRRAVRSRVCSRPPRLLLHLLASPGEARLQTPVRENRRRGYDVVVDV